MLKIPDFDSLFYGKENLKEIEKKCNASEYAFIKKKLNTRNFVSLKNVRFCGVSETKRKDIHTIFFLEYRTKIRESMEQISYEYAICGFTEHGQRVYEAYIEHVITINSNFAILRDNYVLDRAYENLGIGSAGLSYVQQLAKQLHCSHIEGVKHPVKTGKEERKKEMDRLIYFYGKNGYKQESGDARIYMEL